VAEQTPLTGLRAAELAMEAGLPPGVLNVVAGMGKHKDKGQAAAPGAVEALRRRGRPPVPAPRFLEWFTEERFVHEA
jgi:hypothetical protein